MSRTEWSVEQGPRWVAELLVNPPMWFLALVGVGTLAAFGLAGYVWHRDGMSSDVQAEMLSNGLTAGSCLVGTLASVRLLSVPYVGDVLVGVLVGLAVATYAPSASREFVDEVISDAE